MYISKNVPEAPRLVIHDEEIGAASAQAALMLRMMGLDGGPAASLGEVSTDQLACARVPALFRASAGEGISDRRSRERKAKCACVGCPALEACLTGALVAGDDEVRGATTAKERREFLGLLAQRKRVA